MIAHRAMRPPQRTTQAERVGPGKQTLRAKQQRVLFVDALHNRVSW